MLRVRQAAAASGVAVISWLIGTGAADAQICASRKISATGATAQFAVLGRMSARTAWQSKVAGDRRLGSTYSTWLRSKDRRLVCRKVDKRHLCLAIALPCRTVRAASQTGVNLPAATEPPAPVDPKQRPL